MCMFAWTELHRFKLDTNETTASKLVFDRHAIQERGKVSMFPELVICEALDCDDHKVM